MDFTDSKTFIPLSYMKLKVIVLGKKVQSASLCFKMTTLNELNELLMAETHSVHQTVMRV